MRRTRAKSDVVAPVDDWSLEVLSLALLRLMLLSVRVRRTRIVSASRVLIVLTVDSRLPR
jgi:hypothetical protein